MNALKWLWGYMKQYQLKNIAVLLCTAISLIGVFIIPVILSQIVDVVIKDGRHELLFKFSMLLVTGVLLRDVIRYIRTMILESIGQGVVKSIRNNLYRKLETLDASYFDKTKKGDIMSRLTMDTEAIRVVARSTLVVFVDQIGLVVIGLIILFGASWKLTLLIFALSPFILYFAYHLSTKVKKDFIAIREANSALNTVVSENIDGNRVVKAYAREEYEIEKFEEKNENYKKSFMIHVYTWVKYAPPMNLCISLSNALFVVIGGIMLIHNSITIGEFTLFNSCLWTITSPLATIGSLINQFQQFNASSLKIRKLEDEIPKITNRNVKKRDTGIEGKIEFRNVSFSYDGNRVLKDINFSCESGMTIGVIGPTGSGKSSLVNLISRFYDPSAGTVYIDGINVKNIDLKTIHQNVASALQDVFLFSDTIRANIAYGAPNATLEDVIKVAKIADAHSFIEKLPDGYDTVVGERGAGLSGGQKQRISLARALLKNPSILILDDTTSALDMETEYSVQENLKKTKQTKIIIAHRISSVKNADLILVLNQGHLIEWGTHEKLLSQGGYYTGVFNHQFGDFGKAPKYHIKHPAHDIFGGGK